MFAEMFEGTLPRGDMPLVRVHQRPIQIENDCAYHDVPSSGERPDYQSSPSSPSPLPIQSLRKAFAVVRLRQIKHRPNRNDPGRVNLLVGHIIMTLDVIEVNRLG